ncbi:MAG TPA: ATP-binding protein [Geobacteraceae bacterium]|nr:ATP-binding protein [Geobacteraceae bacterium]
MMIMFATSMLVMSVTTVIFYVEDMRSFRKHEVETRLSLAEIICRDNKHAILVNDRAHAMETLRAFAGDPHIISAWVVLSSGEVFASYVRQPGEGGLRTVETEGRVMLAPDALSDNAGTLSGIFASIKTVYSCVDEGKKSCTTVIISDTQELKSRMAGYLALVLLVLLGVAVLGYLVACRLQRVITDPLLSLVNTMERIRTTKDYSIRVDSTRTDEIGSLSGYFNQMLQEMEAHDERLHLYQDKLSEIIAIRTEELVRAKEEAEADVVKRQNTAERNTAERNTSSPGQEWVGMSSSWDTRQILYALMDCVDEEVWFIDADKDRVLANRHACEALGIPLADCLEQEAFTNGIEIYCFDVQKLHCAALPPFFDLLGASVRQMEVMLLKNDNAQRYHLINSLPVRSAGVVTGTVFVVRDITLQKEAENALRFSARRLMEREELLRKALSAELHDEVGRDLTALHLNYEIINSSMPPELRENLGKKINIVNGLLEDLSQKVTNIISELRPPMLDDFGLKTALKWLTGIVSMRHDIDVELLVDDAFPRLRTDKETAIFRIAQEALNNAVKHSGAKMITVSLEEVEGQIRLHVVDDGVGFDSDARHGSAKRQSWGLVIMRERAESVGGSFSVASVPGSGTAIIVEMGRD